MDLEKFKNLKTQTTTKACDLYFEEQRVFLFKPQLLLNTIWALFLVSSTEICQQFFLGEEELYSLF